MGGSAVSQTRNNCATPLLYNTNVQNTFNVICISCNTLFVINVLHAVVPFLKL